MRIVRWTGRTIAHVCGWCDAPLSEEDAAVLRENPKMERTHGICPGCRALYFAGLDEAVTETTA